MRENAVTLCGIENRGHKMIMVLPFLTGAIAAWLGVMGKRRACLWAWFITFVIFIAWCQYHMTDSLPISL
ncbi:DUF5993 family protein [Neopusillimonas aestuarii]|uniref:DUF5993 family protein n=1 Tax=Neopusillimonas aestuarii TaxID=2716226 RepID=UPI00351AE054